VKKLAILGAILAAVVALLAVIVTAVPAMAAKPADTGFDEFGYNYQARIFVGAGDGVDRNLDGTVSGDPTYANDHLVMKWSQAWDDARFNGAAWTPDAWETNEWSGMSPDGSQSVWHYKIIWVGPELEGSAYWREGGYDIWGEFEVIMDQGLDPAFGGGHIWFAHATPTGLGGL
jgi:hypothetical protein